MFFYHQSCQQNSILFCIKLLSVLTIYWAFWKKISSIMNVFLKKSAVQTSLVIISMYSVLAAAGMCGVSLQSHSIASSTVILQQQRSLWSMRWSRRCRVAPLCSDNSKVSPCFHSQTTRCHPLIFSLMDKEGISNFTSGENTQHTVQYVFCRIMQVLQHVSTMNI